MNFAKTMAIIVSLISIPAFAGEVPLGPDYILQGQVVSVYIRSSEIFFAKIKDPADGFTVEVWSNGNKVALATLLSEKAQGHKVKFVYAHMSPTQYDRSNNCYDRLWEGWVCNRLDAIEAVE